MVGEQILIFFPPVTKIFTSFIKWKELSKKLLRSVSQIRNSTGTPSSRNDKDLFFWFIKNLYQGIQVKLFSVFWFNESCELYLVGWHKCWLSEAYPNVSQHSLPWDSKARITCLTKIISEKEKAGLEMLWGWLITFLDLWVSNMYSMSYGLQWPNKYQIATVIK